jgi:hypothetical protein
VRKISRRRLVAVLTATGLAALLVTAAGAAPTVTYSDLSGDGNEAPDITSVVVEEANPGVVNVRVSVGNFQALPSESRIILQFDLDQKPTTGVAGDELVIRFWNDDTLDVLRWDGIRMSPGSADGLSASFASGSLSLTAERAALGGSSAFDLLVLSARTQQAGIGRVTSTDFAPGSGRTTHALPGKVSLTDPAGDHDSAPDITSISVSDTAAGIIQVRVATPNYPVLAADKIIGVGFDLEGRPAGADDVFVAYASGPGSVQVDTEQNGILAPSALTDTASAAFADGVLTLSVHRDELDGAALMGLGIVSLDLVGDGEREGPDFEGDVEALDTAPDDLMGPLHPYALAHRPPVQLRVTDTLRSPLRPRAGGRFSYSIVVRRLDTYRVVRRGSVTCSVFVSGKRVGTTGRFAGGRAHCSLLMPSKSDSSTLRGTVTVRAAGAVVRSTFR